MNKSLDFRITQQKLLRDGYVESYKLCIWTIERPDKFLYGIEDWGRRGYFCKSYISIEDAVLEYVRRMIIALKGSQDDTFYYQNLKSSH